LCLSCDCMLLFVCLYVQMYYGGGVGGGGSAAEELSSMAIAVTDSMRYTGTAVPPRLATQPSYPPGTLPWPDPATTFSEWPDLVLRGQPRSEVASPLDPRQFVWAGAFPGVVYCPVLVMWYGTWCPWRGTGRGKKGRVGTGQSSPPGNGSRTWKRMDCEDLLASG